VVLKDQEAKFECFIQSSSLYSIVWMFGQNIIINQEGFKVLKNQQLNKSTLVINKVNEHFCSSYTCIVKNEFGSSSKSYNLDYTGLCY
jgi:undecaprenyl pyrophosphate phosphatase UppP